MKNKNKNKQKDDIERIKDFLINLGFICNSFESAEHLIYSKKKNVIIIRNRRD